MDDTSDTSKQPTTRLRGTVRSRVLIVICCFVVAPAAGLIASRLAAPQYATAASVGAIWFSMYPIALLNRREPWWAHWARGAFIAVGFWIIARWFR